MNIDKDNYYTPEETSRIVRIIAGVVIGILIIALSTAWVTILIPGW